MSLSDIVEIKPIISKRCRFNIGAFENEFARADLHFFGVDHATYSYRMHVFFNREDADLKTPRDAGAGYAGTISVFGHGGCYGGPGHCKVRERTRPADNRRPHPLIPGFKRLTVTERLRDALKERRTFSLIIVPEITGGSARCGKPQEKLFERITVVTYD